LRTPKVYVKKKTFIIWKALLGQAWTYPIFRVEYPDAVETIDKIATHSVRKPRSFVFLNSIEIEFLFESLYSLLVGELNDVSVVGALIFVTVLCLVNNICPEALKNIVDLVAHNPSAVKLKHQEAIRVYACLFAIPPYIFSSRVELVLNLITVLLAIIGPFRTRSPSPHASFSAFILPVWLSFYFEMIQALSLFHCDGAILRSVERSEEQDFVGEDV
jgi:hypothetical protein